MGTTTITGGQGQGAESDAGAIVEAIERLSPHDIVQLEEGVVVSLPKGRDLHSVKRFLDEYRKAPERIEGTARLTTLESFTAYVNRFKDTGTAIFCADYNSPSPKLIAVLDYSHTAVQLPEEGEKVGTKIIPRFGRHRAQYDFPLSDEWRAWKGVADKGEITQAQFAEFLEERIGDVLSPEAAGEGAKEFAGQLGMALASPQRLLELSRGLAVRVNSKVTQAQSLSTGESQFQYSEEHQNDAGAPLKVPGAFVLGLPVFRNGAPYQVPVRLRYRVAGAQVVWRFVLQRIDRVWDHAMKEACATAEKETDLPLFFGTSEA